MQPGSHGKLAYDIRAQVPGLKTYGSHASASYFRNSELWKIVRYIGIEPLKLRDEVRDEFGCDRLYNRHLRWAILRETDYNNPVRNHPRDYDERFGKAQKRAVQRLVEEVDDNE